MPDPATSPIQVDLKDRVAIVTGDFARIGRSIALGVGRCRRQGGLRRAERR